MFYKIIEKKRDEWLAKKDCPVTNLLQYMISAGFLRNAQIDAIKTYLFLKIVGQNRSLFDLVTSGYFNSITGNDLDELEISQRARNFLNTHPEALALFEYASLKNAQGNVIAPKVVEAIRKNPESIDYSAFFRRLFYNASYTDYLFSLPMGAGKTFLMASFIYLDLYFAKNEPDNPVFAHNFMIFAPSGLKSSVIPSLRTIQSFNPAWIIPEPAASGLKRELIFEVLDQNKSASKSNKTKNPNVQKIAIHQPLDELFGLVAVTNAEKVILDAVSVDTQGNQLILIESTEEDKQESNELRSLIGKLPGLAVFIDEVHHAATDDKKLRAVVNRWAQNQHFNSVVGFSGTPYLPHAEKVAVAEELTVATSEIANIVYYYPLQDGIGNFLKIPKVQIADGLDRLQIVENGIREFLNLYRDKVYPGGCCAKLGIYCGTIEPLEEEIYPLAAHLAEEYGLNPSTGILKFHRGNKSYPAAEDAEARFASLDTPLAQERIVLLAQIGKEGWDCRSLTGIILSQEGDCPTNMVLQTSCRCLRQVQKGVPESALIYLNKSNAEVLNAQLWQQQHISLQEFQKGSSELGVELRRYNRTDYLKLPKLNFYQLHVEYLTEIIAESRDIPSEIRNAVNSAREEKAIVETAEMQDTLNVTDQKLVEQQKKPETANFNCWLFEIVKQSFQTVTMEMLKPYEAELRGVFDMITCHTGQGLIFSSRYRRMEINANIRKAFSPIRHFETKEELVPEDASLLKVDAFTPTVRSLEPDTYIPDQETVQKIVDDDAGKFKPDEKTLTAIEALKAIGQGDMIQTLLPKVVSHPGKDHSFHYLPYHTDSRFEQTFLEEVLRLNIFKKLGLEIYYNGDSTLTEFRIRCFKKSGKHWVSVGAYTPDFLIVRRQDGKIHQAMIVETKGALYAHDPNFTLRRSFMESAFVPRNNEMFRYRRFDYLYLEDSLDEKERISRTAGALADFFQDKN